MPTLSVIMARDAYEKMQSHCRSRTDVEVCGILVGRANKKKDEWACEIVDVIEGEHASEHGVSVTFTSDTWTHVHAAMESMDEDLRIVGWFHTHPGFGIFYSSQDDFIQREFFAEPWMPGIVVDPLADHLGVFHTSNGQINRLDGLTLDSNGSRSIVRSTYRTFSANAGGSFPPRPVRTPDSALVTDGPIQRIYLLLAGMLILQLATVILLLGQSDIASRLLPRPSSGSDSPQTSPPLDALPSGGGLPPSRQTAAPPKASISAQDTPPYGEDKAADRRESEEPTDAADPTDTNQPAAEQADE